MWNLKYLKAHLLLARASSLEIKEQLHTDWHDTAHVTMAPLVDNDARQELLEVFPFSEEELNRLLDLYSVYVDEENGNFTLAHWLASANTAYTSREEDIELVKRVEEEIIPPGLVLTLLRQALSTVFVLGCPDGAFKDTRTFLEAMATILGRRGQKEIIQLINDAAKEDACLWVYCLAVASHVLYTGTFPDALNTSTLETPKSWTFPQPFVQWATWDTPGVSTALSTFMHVAVFTRHHAFRPNVPPLVLPQVNQPSALWKWPWNDLPLSLALMSPTCGGQWRRLYSNDCDGFSFRTMQEAILAFQGPTVILIRSTLGDVFGFSTDRAWKTSRKWFGQGSDSFLFALHPTLAFYPATGDGTHYMYLNLPGIRHPQDLSGMAVGGVAADRPRLHLTESLEKCRACEIDVAYANGPLLSDDMEAYFDVDVLEVWATNETQESFERGVKSGSLKMAIREATRRNVAKVDRMQFVDDFANGNFLNKAFDHREHVGDRHSFTVKDFREEFDKEDE